MPHFYFSSIWCVPQANAPHHASNQKPAPLGWSRRASRLRRSSSRTEQTHRGRTKRCVHTEARQTFAVPLRAYDRKVPMLTQRPSPARERDQLKGPEPGGSGAYSGGRLEASNTVRNGQSRIQCGSIHLRFA